MKKLLLILLSALVLSSCGPSQKDAVAYNNQLVQIQQSLQPKIVQIEQKIALAIQGKDNQKVTDALNEATKTIEDEQKNVESLKFGGDDFGMKKSLLEACDFMKKVYKDEYPKMLAPQMAGTATPIDTQNMQTAVLNIQKRGTAVGEKFMKSQQEFAKKYNIMLMQQ